jgi:hypothetical protein
MRPTGTTSTASLFAPASYDPDHAAQPLPLASRAIRSDGRRWLPRTTVILIGFVDLPKDVFDDTHLALRFARGLSQLIDQVEHVVDVAAPESKTQPAPLISNLIRHSDSSDDDSRPRNEGGQVR